MTCVLLSRELGGIPLDVVISEDHVAEMEIAEHPVEMSAAVSDHAWRLPYRVTLSAVVNDKAAIASWEALLQVQRLAEPFALVTGLRVYDEMLIKSLNPTRDRDHARVLFFTAQCQEVIRVSAQTTAGTGAGGGSGTVSRGQVQARSLTATNSRQTATLSRLAA